MKAETASPLSAVLICVRSAAISVTPTFAICALLSPLYASAILKKLFIVNTLLSPIVSLNVFQPKRLLTVSVLERPS